MKLTTKKIDTSRYVVLAAGQPTGIYIDKSTPAKYRAPQEWDVCIEGGKYLFSCKGLGLCMQAIQKILDATLKANQ
jgi:hypothetical protein